MIFLQGLCLSVAGLSISSQDSTSTIVIRSHIGVNMLRLSGGESWGIALHLLGGLFPQHPGTPLGDGVGRGPVPVAFEQGQELQLSDASLSPVSAPPALRSVSRLKVNFRFSVRFFFISLLLFRGTQRIAPSWITELLDSTLSPLLTHLLPRLRQGILRNMLDIGGTFNFDPIFQAFVQDVIQAPFKYIQRLWLDVFRIEA
jgi:hypothetical protein